MQALHALVAALAALAAAGLAYWLARRLGSGAAHERLELARAEAATLKKTAERDASSARRAAEAEAREQALDARDAAEHAVSATLERLAHLEERMAKRGEALTAEAGELDGRLADLATREQGVTAKSDEARAQRAEVSRVEAEARRALEGQAGATADAMKAQLVEGWVEDTRAERAQELRALEQNIADPEWAREARRVMGIAVQRYQGHYLTERLLSNIALPPGLAETLSAADGALLHAIEQGSGVKLELSDTGEKVRIDSGDGVAREIARRALAKIIKGTAPRGFEKDARKWVEQIAGALDREIVDLGKKAFVELEIPKAHPDIIKLVGRLNYRTSYTQNQWKHAIEAAFIGGMMAAEMGLDVKITRRATLMHDIGKALTHEIDGSHAVIGADYARRLGEAEVVANAIGAHHADEPPNSVYAYLVAAADAMSGARPGARREQSESYSTKLEDLERIGSSFRGVDQAVAVQGGREVRVYVRENEVDDLRAVELSSEIAKQISDELTFPGQIKVTVIRTVEAIEIAN